MGSLLFENQPRRKTMHDSCQADQIFLAGPSGAGCIWEAPPKDLLREDPADRTAFVLREWTGVDKAGVPSKYGGGMAFWRKP
ncbi:MAG: hypothetical protein EHM64_00015 [Ignavibacteriae bacterium]|nr:MAG: hypothetical protein EHM64_00015 [Ignavibacteriota bacterium]